MDSEKTVVAVVCGALGTVLGVLAPFVLNLVNARRRNRAADRKDAMDEVYRLYSEVKADRDSLRTENTSLLVERERRVGFIRSLRGLLKEHGVTIPEGLDGDGEHGPNPPGG